MKKLLLIAAMLCGSVAADEDRPEGRIFIGCLYHYAEQLDDGISDANTIAQVVAESCRKEGRAAFAHKVSAADLSNDASLQKAEAAAIHGVARTVVLKNRADKRKQPR